MVKKSTHWVTIPEETLHTPVSTVSSAKKGKMSGKSKMFWGASFIVLVVLTAALVAPKELASLLQGNLFEQSGVAPLNVIPTSGEGATTETATTGAETAEVPAVTETTPSDQTLVEATTEATAIQIEPVSTTAEPVAEQPVTATTEATTGTTATTGTATTGAVTAGTEATGDIKNELDANRKLLEDLSKQVAEFKEKDKAKTEVIEDLTNIVQEQQTKDTGVHASAPETTTPAVTATTTLGQPAGGYRVNTHIVTTTPYQVLQMNTNQLKSQQAYLGQSVNQQIYRSQLSDAKGTPDSGPREILMLTLILSFVAVLGWKFGKLARA
jgi:hypothetical protein